MLNEVVYEGNMSKVYKLYDNLFFRQANLEIRDQCNSGFVVLDNCTAIIDYPVQSPDHEILDEAEKITGKPVKYFLITHAHCDHVTGFKSLHRDDVQLITRFNGINQLYLEGYPVPKIYNAIEKSDEIVLDGHKFLLTVPDTVTHSPWDMLIGIPEHGIVFTGDMVALEKNMFFHSSNLDGWIEAVEKLCASDWKYFARGHGSIIGHEELNGTLEYLKLLWEARDWQRSHNENVTDKSVARADVMLSAPLANTISKLLKYADAHNVARQINQLYYKLRMETSFRG